jgi:flavin reductase (DIM6/NTAB) family NADH-FMN oxidoreductase RutF
MSFDRAHFKEAMSTFATGVTIVAGLEDGQPVGFTCQSFVSLSLDPPFIALAPARTSTSWPRIAKAGSFCVNVLGQHQRRLCEGFAVSGGDKFQGVEWSPAPETGSPLIADSLAWVDCSVELVHDAGDHELIIGRVLDLGVREGEGVPLLFYRARFATVTAPTGAEDETAPTGAEDETAPTGAEDERE